MSEKRCCRACLKDIRNRTTFTNLLHAPDPIVYLRDGEVPATSYLHCYYFCLKPNNIHFDMENVEDYSYICGSCKTILLKTVDFIKTSQKNETFLTAMYDIRKNESIADNNGDDSVALEDDIAEMHIFVEDEESKNEVVLIEPEVFVKEFDEIEINKYEIASSEEDSNHYELIEDCSTNIEEENVELGKEISTFDVVDLDETYDDLDAIINNTRKKISKPIQTPETTNIEDQDENESYDELEEIIKAARKKVLGTNEMPENDIGETIVKGSSKKYKNLKTVEIDNRRWKAIPKKSFNLGFTCILCRKNFDIQRRLFAHYDNEHDQSTLTFPCDICKWRHISYKAMIFHKHKVHKNTECEDCDICGKVCLPATFKSHRERHKTDVQYACTKCDRIFDKLCTMKQHFRAIHETNKLRRFECQDCDRYYFSEEKLRSHRMVHDGNNDGSEADFLCHICSKTFIKHSDLRVHLKEHSGSFLKCPQCGKKFVRLKTLDYHMRSHAKDFAYECHICSQRLSTWSSLDAHVKRHNGVRYRCKVCDNRFTNISGIRAHAYQHLGYPLYCKLCGNGYPVKKKLRRHLKSAHRIRFEDDNSNSTIDAYLERRRVPQISDVVEEYMEE